MHTHAEKSPLTRDSGSFYARLAYVNVAAIRAIARELDVNRATVRKYIRGTPMARQGVAPDR
jgi:predicted transcriptional regulator